MLNQKMLFSATAIRPFEITELKQSLIKTEMPLVVIFSLTGP